MVPEGRDASEQTQNISLGRSREPLAALVHLVQEGRPVRTLRLGPGVYRAGAAGDCDLVIDDKSVSRQHLQLALAPEGVQVVDLQSRNGTYYLGQRIGELTVSLGSRLRVGEAELVFEADVADFEGTQGEAKNQYGELWGNSPAMQRLFTLLGRLEGSLSSVLIEGESGTGKELVARALHDNSQVARGPFVAINCGALDRSLVRSELFGHKKGAFTGATHDAAGAFEAAEGGTLFLDEVGELPEEVQPVLLRVLETGTYARVGEHRERRAKVRLVAATHRNLKEDVEEGSFRGDLYYRLMVVRLTLPPLRHRPEDVPLLARHLAKRLQIQSLPEEIIEELGRRPLKGNVRELKHALESYAALGELPPADGHAGGALEEAVAPFVDPERSYAEQKEALIDAMTRSYLQKLMDKTGGNRSEAARVAGLQRGYLRRLLEKYELG